MLRDTLKSIFILIAFVFSAVNLFAVKPPNDNCSSADNIVVSNGGFGLGFFKGKTVDITNATVQSGEYFLPLLVNAGNSDKSVWYKFSLPTARGVKIELKQPGNRIPASGAGFEIYYSNNCLPSSDAISSSKLTAIERFGSTGNPCLKAGDYLIQVCANSNSNDSVWVELTITASNTSNSYDSIVNPLEFGVIKNFTSKVYSFDAGCQTIDNSSEVCSDVLGTNYKDFTGTAWITFKTDNLTDFLRFNIGDANFSSPYSETNPIVFGYKVYKGDVKLSGLSGITLLHDCQKLEQKSSALPYFEFNCGELDSNTTYTVQFFLNKLYNGTINTSVNKLGKVTNGSDPKSIKPGNVLNALKHSEAGSDNIIKDAFGCNSFMNKNLCGADVPVSYVHDTVTYDMNTWVTFTLSHDADIYFIPRCSQLPLYLRVYRGDVTTDCNLGVYVDFSDSTTIKCMPPGKYSLQILGASKLRTTDDYLNNKTSHFGRDIYLDMRVSDKPSINRFNLSNKDSVEKINNNNPLVTGKKYSLQDDIFGCSGTVMPDSILCGKKYTKGIYRTLKIDRNGILSVQKPYPSANYIEYNLYDSDASLLAVQQNKFSAGEFISGMNNIKDCYLTGDIQKFCVAPGMYTIMSFGNDEDMGFHDNPMTIWFDTVGSIYADTLHPEAMGDITSKTNIFFRSGIDHISCLNNLKVIGGEKPCANKVIQLYREFYISETKYFSIRGSHPFKIFQGRVSTDGTSKLKAIKKDCGKRWNTDYCYPLPPGWYTVVSYGNLEQTGNLGDADSIYYNPPILPKHNKPYKADSAKVDWGPNSGTKAYPNTGKLFVLDNDLFNCIPDTPIAGVCSNKYTRVSYYTFTVKRQSFVTIKNISSEMISKVYNFDVRKDSSLLTTAIPLQPCIAETFYGISFCNMKPGIYTLVVYAVPGLITSIQPIIYIDRVENSRFDNASSAYDFGRIAGDGNFHYGKTGDVNPLDTDRSPSNDFISCPTGAQPDDPEKDLCEIGDYQGTGMPSVRYPVSDNYAQYSTDENTSNRPRRNLWYTFVSKGAGNISIKVLNKTPGDKVPFPISVYLSNEDGTKTFNELLALKQVDSTIAGLTKVVDNHYDSIGKCYYHIEGVKISIPQCGSMLPRRYYIIVDNSIELLNTRQLEVGIKYDSIPSASSFNDYFADANIINGLGETNKPYTHKVLDPGKYTGAIGNYLCASKSNSDGAVCGNKTLWYGFDIAKPCLLRINYEILNDKTVHYDDLNMKLFKEKTPGDSSTAGMEKIQLELNNIEGSDWGQTLIKPGRYYIMLTGCSYTNELVSPNLWLIRDPGDFCYDPVSIDLNKIGVAADSLNVDSHTIGEGYGEDGTGMGCLSGPAGYKSSWFRINLQTNSKVDLHFQLENSTSARASEVRYRVLYGNCNSMYAGGCNPDALTQFTINCVLSGDYYVQVVSPEDATGSLKMIVSDSVTKDTNCVSIDPRKLHVDFTTSGNCSRDTIKFFNKSQRGNVIKYKWYFDDKNAVSDSINPYYVYPSAIRDTIYNVKLVVRDTSSEVKDSVSLPLLIKLNPVYLTEAGNTKMYCGTDSIQIGSPAIEGFIYKWIPSEGLSNAGIAQPKVKVNKNTEYVLSVSRADGGCKPGIDSVMIGYKSKPENNLPDSLIICKNSNANLKVDGASADDYKWVDINNKVISDKDSATLTSPGIYYVSMKYGDCEYKDTVKISQSASVPDAKFTITPSTGEAPVEVSFTNRSNGADTYRWLFGDNDSSYVADPKHTFIAKGNYKVMLYAINKDNCTDTSSLYVKISEKQEENIPNVFTPNDDATNEKFIVKIPGLDKFHGMIFDRWGLLLYEWFDINDGWDGKYKGRNCSDGVYYYIIEGSRTDNSSLERKGWIELLR